MVTKDQILGCIHGGSLGDVIGSHFEGKARPVSFFVPAHLRVSDDTQLTLATCESITENRGVNPEWIASSFRRWFRSRRLTGLGASTLKALAELDAGGHWATVGASGERSAGNGAAMRVAPLAFVLDPDCPDDRRTIRDVCRITHRNDEAYAGGLAVIRAIRWAVQGLQVDRALIDHLVQTLPDCSVRDRFAAIKNQRLTASAYRETCATIGYVADSVPFAVLLSIDCIGHTFLDSMRIAVESGGDTDTICSMVGQIRGACFGVSDIPSIAESIGEIALIRDVAAAFARTVTAM